MPGAPPRAWPEPPMRPDPSQWRTPDAYAYLDDLIASDLAWECLRRNADYQADFQASAHRGADAALSARWGLRFPGRSVPLSFRRGGVLVAGRRSGHCRPGARLARPIERCNAVAGTAA
ncbi:transcriptional regulator domain-containing protein [Phenylobacterium sp.]|uniref:transcriptional regulator domain-containing protein n=1 Tax=Phenylobacterium sp. TaxID=1871053 RepID=UPI0035B1C5E8